MYTMEDLSSFWQDIAKRQIMKEEVHENIQKMTEKECQKYASPKILQDGIVRAKDIKVSKKDTILEIGAGPGIISFELAKRAKHLTAIEPSLGFSSIFMKKSRELGITNVNIVTDFFENFDITQKYDIVVSSFSLITLNIVDFLKRMNAIAKRACYIHWFYQNCTLDRQNKEISSIVGRKYEPLIPTLDIVFNILYQMNISPEIKLLESTCFDRSYKSISIALKAIKNIFCIKEDVYDEKLRVYIKDVYLYKNGTYIYPDKTKFASLSWKK